MGLLDALQWATTGVAQAMLAALGTPLAWEADRLHHAGGFVAQVDLGCTAWALSWLLVGVLAVFGSMARVPWRRLTAGMMLGVAVVFIVNQLRLAAVIWTGVHAPSYLAWVHEGLGPLLLVLTGAAIVAATVGRAAGRRPPPCARVRRPRGAE